MGASDVVIRSDQDSNVLEPLCTHSGRPWVEEDKALLQFAVSTYGHRWLAFQYLFPGRYESMNVCCLL